MRSLLPLACLALAVALPVQGFDALPTVVQSLAAGAKPNKKAGSRIIRIKSKSGVSGKSKTSRGKASQGRSSKARSAGGKSSRRKDAAAGKAATGPRGVESRYRELMSEAPPGDVTRLAGLYQGEQLLMPSALLERVGVLNDLLKPQLSEADYLALLKGELAWYIDHGEPGDCRGLEQMLERIAEAPHDYGVFKWPRLLPVKPPEGVYLREFAAPEQTTCTRSDEQRIDFWDQRTGEKQASLHVPSAYASYLVRRGDDVFLTLPLLMSRSDAYLPYREIYLENATTWTGAGHATLFRLGTGEQYTFLFSDLQETLRYARPTGHRLVQEAGFPMEEYLTRGVLRADGFDVEEGEKREFSAYLRDIGYGLQSRQDGEFWRRCWEGSELITCEVVPPDASAGMLQAHDPESIRMAQGGTLNLRTLEWSSASGTSASGARASVPGGGELLAKLDFLPEGDWGVRSLAEAEDGACCFLVSATSEVPGGGWETVQYVCLLSREGVPYVLAHLTERRGEGLRDMGRELLTPDACREVLARAAVADDEVTVLPYVSGSELGVCEPGRVHALSRVEEGVYDVLLSEPLDDQQHQGVLLRVNLGDQSVSELAALPEDPAAWLPGLGLMLTRHAPHAYTIHRMDEAHTLTALATLYTLPESGFAIVLPNGHYAGSPGCERYLGVVRAGHDGDMASLAPWRKRPAEVLEVLGGAPDRVAALRRVTERWLASLGVVGENPEPAPEELPEATVQLPPPGAQEAQCRFRVVLKAAAGQEITQLRVWVDGVPYEVPQASLPVPKGEQREVELAVPLVSGRNWICVAPVDSLGVQGRATRFWVYGVAQEKQVSRVHVVALGVTEEARDGQQPAPDAAQDAADVADCLAGLAASGARKLVLRQHEVTRDAIPRVKEFLRAAAPQDAVYVYVSGRGVRVDGTEAQEREPGVEATSPGGGATGSGYVYVPAGVGEQAVSTSGIPLEELLRVLEGSPARRRVLLLDTTGTDGLADVLAQDSGGSGVSLLASGAGQSTACEAGGQSVFAAVLRRGLLGSAALGSEGEISLPGLARYLGGQLAERTHGAQRAVVSLVGEADQQVVARGLWEFLTPASLRRNDNWVRMLARLRQLEACGDSSPRYAELLRRCVEEGAPEELQLALARLCGRVRVEDLGLRNPLADGSAFRLGLPGYRVLRQLLDQGMDPHGVAADGHSLLFYYALGAGACYFDGEGSVQYIGGAASGKNAASVVDEICAQMLLSRSARLRPELANRLHEQDLLTGIPGVATRADRVRHAAIEYARQRYASTPQTEWQLHEESTVVARHWFQGAVPPEAKGGLEYYVRIPASCRDVPTGDGAESAPRPVLIKLRVWLTPDGCEVSQDVPDEGLYAMGSAAPPGLTPQ